MARSLTADELTAGTIALLDADGAAGFSIRRLAERVHIAPATVYGLVHDTSELLASAGAAIGCEWTARAAADDLALCAVLVDAARTRPGLVRAALTDDRIREPLATAIAARLGADRGEPVSDATAADVMASFGHLLTVHTDDDWIRLVDGVGSAVLHALHDGPRQRAADDGAAAWPGADVIALAERTVTAIRNATVDDFAGEPGDVPRCALAGLQLLVLGGADAFTMRHVARQAAMSTGAVTRAVTREELETAVNGYLTRQFLHHVLAAAGTPDPAIIVATLIEAAARLPGVFDYVIRKPRHEASRFEQLMLACAAADSPLPAAVQVSIGCGVVRRRWSRRVEDPDGWAAAAAVVLGAVRWQAPPMFSVS